MYKLTYKKISEMGVDTVGLVSSPCFKNNNLAIAQENLTKSAIKLSKKSYFTWLCKLTST